MELAKQLFVAMKAHITVTALVLNTLISHNFDDVHFLLLPSKGYRLP